MLAQSENPQYTKATSNKLSDTFTSSLEIQNQNSTERDCVTSQTGNYELLTELRKFYEKSTQITQNSRKSRKFTQKIFAIVNQNFEWSTPRVITEILI